LRQQYASDLSRLSDAGLIELSDDLMRLTRHGALLSNEVFATFI
jgi:coproporphyrinogen III oxidase-like Fe-S oxidoreductase